MTKYFLLKMVLCVTLVATASLDSVAAASCDTVLEALDPVEPIDPFNEVDALEDGLANFLQWIDKIFDSPAAGHTSVISIWNH